MKCRTLLHMHTRGAKLYRVGFLRHKFCGKCFVRNLFGIFKDLQGSSLGCAFAHLYHAKGFG